MMALRGQESATTQWEWRPVISWYPGHIARAEKQLVDMLKLVDVVIELRDSRIPRSTCHPLIDEWVGHRGHILVMNRFDSVPTSVVQDWTRHLAESNTEAHWVNAKEGKGIEDLKRAIVRAGKGVNERRKAKGLLPRAVRACILGFPNVGKSALINRLIGRAKLKSENRAGVTRSFSWSAVGGARERSKTKGSAGGNEAELQLLDTPGIIPAKQVGQRSAYMLAVCDDIGAAAYDTRAVALTLIEELKDAKSGYIKAGALEARYGHGLGAQTAEDFLERVAEERCGGDLVRAETMVLRDFRDGRLGLVGLEAPFDERAAAGAKPRAAQPIRRSPSAPAAVETSAAAEPSPAAAGVHGADPDERH
jgi:ribosome biogenesis GTPase A